MKTSINVLVIDSDNTVTKEMEKYFSSHEVIKVVACVNNGEDGLQYIINHNKDIDIIVMDLILPKLDGIFILNELSRRRIKKNVIITTNFKDDKILDEVNNLGINFYMLKPVSFLSLERRITAIDINNNLKNNKVFNQEAVITDLLHSLGVPSHIRGYQYIREGIKIVYQNNNISTYITKDVYPEIARKFNTTATRVERAIRHAIEISWSRGDINLMEDIFGNSVNVNRDKPTNSEFLTTLADRLKVSNNLIYN